MNSGTSCSIISARAIKMTEQASSKTVKNSSASAPVRAKQKKKSAVNSATQRTSTVTISANPSSPKTIPACPEMTMTTRTKNTTISARGLSLPAMICRNSRTTMAGPGRLAGPTSPVRLNADRTKNRTGKRGVISIGMTGQTIRPKPLPVLF